MTPVKALLFLGSVLACLPASGGSVSLGHPVESITIPSAAHGRSADGRDWICMVANGLPATMTVVDAKTGERLHSYPLPYTKQSFSTHGSGDTAYIGTAANGMFYKWNPQMTDGPQLVTPRRHPFDQRHILVTDVGENGNIYMGTYPDALILEYDTKTNKLRNLGRASEEATYLKGVSEINGQLFGATHSKDALVQVDMASGKRTALPYPKGYGANTTVNRAQRVGPYMFFLLGSDMNVYDPQSRQWLGKVRNASNFSRIAEPFPGDDNAYLVVRGRLMRYNLKTHEQQALDVPVASLRSAGWIELDEADYPGWTLAAASVRGDILHYNPQSGKHRVIKGDVPMNPVSIRAMGQGPDGKVYIGGYLYPMSIASVSEDGTKTQKLPLAVQAEAITSVGDNLVIGTYPGAGVRIYNVTEPWKDGENPKTLFSLRDYKQDRPFGFAAFDGKLAVGTVPVSSRLGGVLALYDMNTHERQVFENVVKDQSIVTLAYRDGFIYGGTSIWGGLGIEPAAESAELFIWDVAKAKVVWSGAILPGVHAINALTFDNKGNLWGMAGGTIFEFNPQTRKLVKSRELYPHTWARAYWQSATLEFDTAQNVFYGSNGRRLFRFNPQNWEMTELTNGGYFARDAQGRIFYSLGSEVFRLDQE